MAYVPPDPENLRASNGPFALGISISCVFTGMLVTQTWNYFDRYEQDTWPLKLAAGLVCLLNVVSTGLDLQIVWNMSVTHFGDYHGLAHTPKSHIFSVLMTSLVTVTTQTFFAERSWRVVNRNMAMGILFAILVSVTFVGAAGSAAAHLAGANSEKVVQPLALMWLWCSSVTDVLISGTLMHRLWQSRQQPDVSARTQNILDGILLVVLSTASVTTVVAAVDAVFFTFFFRGSNTHSALTINMPRLYACCLLFTLNSRSKLRSAMHQGSGSSSGRPVQTWHGRNASKKNHKGVVVTRTEEIEEQDHSQFDLDRLGYRTGPQVRRQESDKELHTPTASIRDDIDLSDQMRQAAQ